MSAPKLMLPRVEVTLADGSVHNVQILNVDLLRWDRTAAKHGWPNFEVAKALHSTFLSWSALRRTGDIPPDTTWERYSDELCLQVQGMASADGAEGLQVQGMASADGAEGNGAEPEIVHPIPSAPGPG